jgi:membrane carboxypeptidase/penicillin-binding protein
VTQAWRQPGSSFKPFIYSAALEKGFTPATVVNDGPLFFDAAHHRRPALGAEELRRQASTARCRCAPR